jgi:hypothetical protein
LPSATPLTPDQLVEAQLPRTANLSNQIQLDQIAQQYLQAQLEKYNKTQSGGRRAKKSMDVLPENGRVIPPDRPVRSRRKSRAKVRRSVRTRSTEAKMRSISSDVRSPTSTEVRSPTSTSTEVRSPTSTSTEVRSPTSTSTEVRSPTSTSTEVRSPTSTSTEVRSPTSTSTDAYTQGNVTVTGGAGAGATTVYIGCAPEQLLSRADKDSNEERSKGSSTRMERMIKETSASRVPGVMPDLMTSTSGERVPGVMPDLMQATSGSRPNMLINELMKSTSAVRPTIPIKEMMKATSASRPKLPIEQMMLSVSNKKTKKQKKKSNKLMKARSTSRPTIPIEQMMLLGLNNKTKKQT